MKASLCFLLLACSQICRGAPTIPICPDVLTGGLPGHGTGAPGGPGDITGSHTLPDAGSPGGPGDMTGSLPIPGAGGPGGPPGGLPIPGAGAPGGGPGDMTGSLPIPGAGGPGGLPSIPGAGAPGGGPGGLPSIPGAGAPGGGPGGLPSIPGAGAPGGAHCPSPIEPIVDSSIGSSIVAGKDHIIHHGKEAIDAASHLDIHRTSQEVINTADAAARTVANTADDILPGIGPAALAVYTPVSVVAHGKAAVVSAVAVPASHGILSGRAI